jgi:hypothetical protein
MNGYINKSNKNKKGQVGADFESSRLAVGCVVTRAVAPQMSNYKNPLALLSASPHLPACRVCSAVGRSHPAE